VNRIYGAFGAFVKVRLSNPRPTPFVLGDGILALPGTVEVDALIDPRAAVTSILPDLIRFPLGLDPVLGGRRRWSVDLEAPGGVRFLKLEAADGTGGRDFADARRRLGRAAGSVREFHVILGRDVLRQAALEGEGRSALGITLR
jgi:hypothetical protein